MLAWQVWGPPRLRHRYAEVCLYDLQPLKLWLREKDNGILVGAHRSQLGLLLVEEEETQGVRAAALVCQLATRLCESKYRAFQPHIRMQLARQSSQGSEGGSSEEEGSSSRMDVDELLSSLGPLSVSGISRLAAGEEAARVAAFIAQLFSPLRPSGAAGGGRGGGSAEALQLVPTDFFFQERLRGWGFNSESVDIVRCPKVSQ